MNKFEKLIEYIINDEDQKARELFHDIVVEKSRDIYESIMDEESMEETVAGQQVEDMVDEVGGEEAAMEDDEASEEEFELDGEEDGDVAGDFPADSSEEPAGEDDAIMNIDAKLDELLAKFDEIMGDEGHDDMGAEEPAMDMGADDMGAEEEPEMFEAKGSGNPFAKKGSAMSGKSGSAASGKSGSAASGKSGSAKSGASGKPFEGKKSAGELMREYVDKIQDMNLTGSNEGDAVGAAGKKVAVNTKPGSVGPGADFGGNVIKTDTSEQNQDGTSPTKASNEYNKGQGEIKSGNRNVPGGKADKLEGTGKEYSKEHGAEGQTTDGKVAVATKSVQAQNTGKK